jgi:hypothetical protein
VSDVNDLELAVRVRVEGQQALDSTGQSVKALGATAKTESASVDVLLAGMKDLTAAVNQLTAALPAASSGLSRAGASTRALSSDAAQATQSLRGMGSEIGVNMPRFVSRFLVSLGPVAGALSAAFSVIAIVGILEMLPKLYQAIEDFGDKLGGVTERTRKQYREMLSEQDKLQQEQLSNSEKLRDLNTVGVEGSAKTALQMRNLTASAKDYGLALKDASKALAAAQATENSFSIWSPSGDRKRAEEEVDRLQAKVNRLSDETRKRLGNSPEAKTLGAEQSAKVADERRATALATVEGTKALGNSVVTENERTIKQLRELKMISAQEETDLLKSAADDKLRIEVASAQAVYNVKSRQPGVNKALLTQELNDQKALAQQRADAAKQDIDMLQRIKDQAQKEALAKSVRENERQIDDVQLSAARGTASRASGFSTRAINSNVKPGRESDAVQATYNEAIRLSDELQAKEQARIDKEQAWADAEIDALKRQDDLGKVALDREKLIADIGARRDEARIAAEEKIGDLQKKRLDENKAEAATLFDAVRGGGAGVQKYFINMAEGVEKNLFVNLLTMGKGGGAMGSITDALRGTPGQRNKDGSNSFLGDLLQGGQLGQRSALKVKTSDKPNVDTKISFGDESGSATLTPDVVTRKENTVALTALNTSVTQLTAVMQGKQPSVLNGGVAGTGSTAAVTSGGAAAASTAGSATAPSASSRGAVSAASASAASTPGSAIGSAISLLTLGSSLAAGALGNNGSPSVRVLSGPGQGKSGAIQGDLTLPQMIALGGVGASAGFGALTKAGILKPSANGGGAIGDFASGLVGGPAGGLGGVIKGWSDPNTSWSSEVGSIAGLGVGVASGVMSAIKGFSSGGARGITSGIASVAGTAAMLDPEPISKGILTAVAAVGGIVKDIFGDPKAQRGRDITNALSQEEFAMPSTVNGVQALGGAGNNLNYNKYGKLQFSPFAGYNVTDQTQYQNQLTGQYFNTPGSVSAGNYVGLPGISPSQLATNYRPAGNNGGTTINLTVHALDSQSIIDRSGDIGLAVYKELNAGGALGLRIQQTVLGA